MTGTTEHRSTPLISRLDIGSSDRAIQDPRLEPAFLDHERGRLTPDSHGHAEETKRYLAHAISRRPTALRLHIERILLHAETGDPAILGALCGLFRVLGDKGTPLRRRMLALARPLLSTKDHQRLQQYLRQGEDDFSSLRELCRGSVLCPGISGTTRLIAKQSEREAETSEPLQMALDQLELGQTEMAQETLEQALLADPERVELHHALLEIHQHLRDRAQLAHFLQRLNGRANPAEREWRRLQEQLDTGTTTS